MTVLTGALAVMVLSSIAFLSPSLAALAGETQFRAQPQASTMVAEAQSPLGQIETPFDQDGYSVLVKIAPKECLVGSNLDLRTMIAKISNLQAGGLIRADVSPAHVRAHAWTTASSVALKLQPLIIVRVFDKMPDLDNCGFVQTITGFDGKPQAAYAFKMTRDLYRKVDWSSYVPTNLPKDSKNFTIGAAIASHMNAEAKAKQ